jgi:hypothetical protein
MKLLIANNISINEKDSLAFSTYLDRSPLTWNVFKEFLLAKPLIIRKEISNLIPRTGFFFHGSFTEALRIEGGSLFANVSTYCRQKLIEICVYSGQRDLEVMKSFILNIGCLTLKHDLVLQQSDFVNLLNEI